MASADPGHGFDHIKRVVQNAITLGREEQGNPQIILPAAFLHDCVSVPKNDPQRSQASRLAAQAAITHLRSIGYSDSYDDDIVHAIESHSFSANIPCRTIDAKIVQDADRLEALGAIGIARCLMTGGSLQQLLYDFSEPFPFNRPPEDRKQSIDHFFAKLLLLPGTMQTESGRKMAWNRTKIMTDYLSSLASEIGTPHTDLKAALSKIGFAT